MTEKIAVRAGAHRRIHCPVRVPWTHTGAPTGLAVGSEPIPVQHDGDSLVFISAPVEAGATATYVEAEPSEGAGGVQLEDNGEQIRVTLGGEEFTTYHYREVPARPYFFPVLAPGGIPVTRSWPMRDDVEGEKHDHPHHKSMYFAFGSVNGVDNWSEEAGHGFTVHKTVDEIVSGPVFGRFATTSDWIGPDGTPVLVQKATVTFWDSRHYSLPPEAALHERVTRGFAPGDDVARLLELGRAAEHDDTLERAQALGMPFVDLRRHAPEPAAVALVPEDVARLHGVIPIKKDGNTNTLYVAMADVNDPQAADDLRAAARCEIRAVLAGPTAIRQAIDRVYGRPAECRIMDVDLRLTAAYGDVRFGDTKEGGLLTVRVASSMDVSRREGGRIENAYGGIDEGETWGRAAHWCDYSGVVNGQLVGIAVMDHPDSFRYPTYWHVRDYGLMGANPFALGDYTQGAKDGSHVLPAGQSLRFVYRVLVHNGDAGRADVRGHYLDFVSPPAVTVEA